MRRASQEEDEAKAREWLAEVLNDDRFRDPGQRLATLLRDGTALCRAANALWGPSAVPRVQPPLTPFRAMENIAAYLRFCPRVGVPRAVIFATPDLFEGRDIGAVLLNLRFLRAQFDKGAQLASLPSSSAAAAAPAPIAADVELPFHRRVRSEIPQSPSSPLLQQKQQQQPQQQQQQCASPSVSVRGMDEDLKIKEELMYNSGLEQAVREWMAAVLNEPMETLFPPDQTFAGALHTGVTLCRLANSLRSGVCARVSQSSVAFAQMENVATFIRACVALGMPQSDLFGTSDLFEAKNINRVISSLSSLAKHAFRRGFTTVEIRNTTAIKTLFSQALVENSLDDDPDGTAAEGGGSSSTACEPPTDPKQLELLHWANEHITKARSGSTKLFNFGPDVRSGVKLIKLVEALAREPIGRMYDVDPRVIWGCMQNALLLFEFVRRVKFVDVMCCTPQDVVTGNAAKVTEFVAFLRDRFDLDYAFKKMVREGTEVNAISEQELRALSKKAEETSAEVESEEVARAIEASIEAALEQEKEQQREQEPSTSSAEGKLLPEPAVHHTALVVSEPQTEKPEITEPAAAAVAAVTTTELEIPAEEPPKTAPKEPEMEPAVETPRAEPAQVPVVSEATAAKPEEPPKPEPETEKPKPSAAKQETEPAQVPVVAEPTAAKPEEPTAAKPEEPPKPEPETPAEKPEKVAKPAPKEPVPEDATPKKPEPTKPEPAAAEPETEKPEEPPKPEPETEKPEPSAAKPETEPAQVPVVSEATAAKPEEPPKPEPETEKPEPSAAKPETEPAQVPVVSEATAAKPEEPPRPETEKPEPSAAKQETEPAQTPIAAEPEATPKTKRPKKPKKPKKSVATKPDEPVVEPEPKKPETTSTEPKPVPEKPAAPVVTITEPAEASQNRAEQESEMRMPVPAKPEGRRESLDEGTPSQKLRRSSSIAGSHKHHHRHHSKSRRNSTADLTPGSPGVESEASETSLRPHSGERHRRPSRSSLSEASLVSTPGSADAATPPSPSPLVISQKPTEGATPTPNEEEEEDPERVARAQLAMRRRVAQEVLTSEDSYLKSMMTLCAQVVKPLIAIRSKWDTRSEKDKQKEKAPPLKESEIRNIFANVCDITENHRRFFAKLRERFATWSDETTTLGDLFLDAMPQFEQYGPFLQNYASSVLALHYLLKHNMHLRLLVEAFERIHIKLSKLNLPAYLVMPVQRLPRYVMLVNDLLRYTPATHPDSPLLKQITEQLPLLVQRLNQGIDPRRAELVQRIVAIADSISGEESDLVVRGDRTLIREGAPKKLTLTLPPATEGGKAKEKTFKRAYLFLFDDMLVCCEATPKADKPFAFLEHVPIDAIANVVTSDTDIRINHQRVANPSAKAAPLSPFQLRLAASKGGRTAADAASAFSAPAEKPKPCGAMHGPSMLVIVPSTAAERKQWEADLCRLVTASRQKVSVVEDS